MTKWRINISSHVIVEADTPDQARREVIASQEAVEESLTMAEDILLNATIESAEVEQEDNL